LKKVIQFESARSLEAKGQIDARKGMEFLGKRANKGFDPSVDAETGGYNEDSHSGNVWSVSSVP
jgi:hypothetical protein